MRVPLLRGRMFNTTRFTLNTDFFSHWFVEPKEVVVFADNLSDLLMSPHLNREKLPQLRDVVVETLVSKTVSVHPIWKQELDELLATMVSQTCPVRAFP